jgi:hypothetical protein
MYSTHLKLAAVNSFIKSGLAEDPQSSLKVNKPQREGKNLQHQENNTVILLMSVRTVNFVRQSS